MGRAAVGLYFRMRPIAGKIERSELAPQFFLPVRQMCLQHLPL